MPDENPTPTNPNPAPTTPAETPSDQVSLPRTEYDAIMASHREVSRVRSEEATRARTEGERLAALERRYLDAERDGAISRAFSNVKFTSDQAAADARVLMGVDVEVRQGADGSAEVVHRPTGRPLSEVAPELLQGGRFAHLLAPTAGGGSGFAETRRGQVLVDNNPAPAGSMAARLIDATRSAMAGNSAGSGPSFGLRH